MIKELVMRILKKEFFRREIEIYRVAMTDVYGIREVWRSRFKTPDGVIGWRKYSDRQGDKVQMTTEQMQSLLKTAETFVRKIK